MDKKLRIYLHIPFCAQKCRYCDFVSFVGQEEQFEAYTRSLCNEIASYGRFFKGREISSVYIGGGTPSVLPAEMTERIMSALTSNFTIKNIKEKRKGLRLQKKIRPKTEVSMECNPGTVDKKKLKAYFKAGINRLSFGLQSADEEDLRMLGRIHTFDDYTDAFGTAREVGFDNINVDLMQAIPGQTMAKWKKTLFLATLWKPEHISAYSLIVEKDTPFYRMQEEGRLVLPDEDTEREIYYYTQEYLEKTGYQRYEISNFALPDFACQHNIGYWKRDEYLGLGLNSSAMVHNYRWKNTENLSRYMEYFSDAAKASEEIGMLMERIHAPRDLSSSAFPEGAGPDVICDLHRLSHKEQMEEFMFLGLRMTEGVNKQEFFDTFGQDFDFTYGNVVYDLTTKELLQEKNGRVFLTDRGVDVSNTVLAEFLLEGK